MTIDYKPGLDGVIAARTRLSRVDGQAGELTIAGCPVAELARHVREPGRKVGPALIDLLDNPLWVQKRDLRGVPFHNGSETIAILRSEAICHEYGGRAG